MRKSIRLVISLIASTLVALGATRVCAAQAQPSAVATTHLKVGDVAPDFKLLSDEWQPVQLSDFRGKKNVIIAIYVLAFTPG